MTQKIGDSIEGVLDFLRSIPLSDNTVGDYQVRYRSILAYCDSKGIVCFSENEARMFTDCQMIRFRNGEISERHLRKLRRSAFLLAEYMEGKELVWKSAVFPDRELGKYYANVLDDYTACLSQLLASGTVRRVLSMIRKFLFFLESNGIYEFTRLTADHVKLFLHDVAKKHKNSMADLIWAMRQFMRFLNETDLSPVNADRYLPHPAPARKKVLPCFTGKETDAILSAAKTATALGKRDYAILKLAIETGLRAVDILGLKLTDINWYKCEIAIIQDKTGEAIQLPLLAGAGNAIADYILHARPESDSPHIFLRTVKPHTKLGNTGNGKNIIGRYLAKAGIQHKAWDGKAFHAFRRTHGTRLVEAEVALPDVADLLGHKVLDSMKRYISQNDDKLRACCLDILKYATRKEGLV
jgi:site-specific recombinase XerD